MYESHDRITPWVLLILAFFNQKSRNFALSKNTDIDCALVQNFVVFLEIVLINMVSTLMMLTKVATLGLLKVKLFWNKG